MQCHTANLALPDVTMVIFASNLVLCTFWFTNTCLCNINSQLTNYSFANIENEFSTFVSNGSLDSVLTTCSSTLSLFVNFFSVYKNIKTNSFLKKGYPGPRDFSFFFSNQNEPWSRNFKLLVIAALRPNLVWEKERKTSGARTKNKGLCTLNGWLCKWGPKVVIKYMYVSWCLKWE